MIDGDPRNLIVDDEFDANSTNVPDVYQYLAKIILKMRRDRFSKRSIIAQKTKSFVRLNLLD